MPELTPEQITSAKKTGKWIVLAIVVLLVLFGSVRFVGAGQRGVVLTFGAVQDKVLGEGLQFKIPFVQKILKIDIKTVKHEASAAAYSRDLQVVDVAIALNYHVNKDTPNKLIQEIGRDYESRIIDPAIQESIKATVALFTAQELVEQRPKVKEEIKKQLTDRLNVQYITVDDFSITNFDFSDAYESAVEAKQVAQQNALKAENDLQRIKVEAEQRVAQAKAEAEAIRVQSQAANNQNYVQLKALEVQANAITKWDGHLPQYNLGDSVPFISLPQK